jgi:hypothetical protein
MHARTRGAECAYILPARIMNHYGRSRNPAIRKQKRSPGERGLCRRNPRKAWINVGGQPMQYLSAYVALSRPHLSGTNMAACSGARRSNIAAASPAPSLPGRRHSLGIHQDYSALKRHFSACFPSPHARPRSSSISGDSTRRTTYGRPAASRRSLCGARMKC